MDAAYLQSTLGPLLSEGLAATLLRSPPDPVEFLAHWLRKSVAEKGALSSRANELQQLKEADESEAKAQARGDEESSRAGVSKAEAAEAREKSFNTLLESATNAEQLMPAFLQGIRELTGASSAYIAHLVTDKESETRALRYVAATPDNEFLLDKRLDQKKGRVTHSLFGEDEPEEEPEQEEDENGNPIVRPPVEKPLKSVFVPNVLMGSRALQLHFWRLPSPGSYVAVRIRYPGAVSDEVLDEAVEREAELLQLKSEQDEAAAQAKKEAEEEKRREAGLDDDEDDDGEDGEDDEDEDEEIDEEDEEAVAKRARKARRRARAAAAAAAKEAEEDETDEAREAREAREEEERSKAEEEFILANLARPSVDYALCLDTLGQAHGRRFSDEQLETIQRYAKALQAKLASLDRAAFTAERTRRKGLLAFQTELREGSETGTLRSEEEKAEELERLSDELEASGKPMAEEDVLYRYRTDLLLGDELKPRVAEWAESLVAPRGGNLVVLQAALFLLGYEKSLVVDAEGRADWARMRRLLTDDFFARMRDYDPRASSHESVPAEKKYTESVAVTKLVGAGPIVSNGETVDDGVGLQVEEVRDRNYAMSELLLWVRAALGVKRRAKIERQKAKRDAERKAAAEALAAKKAEARRLKEEEEARRIAEGGEAKEDGEDEEEEEEEDDE